MPSSGDFPEEKIIPPRVQPVYASPSLNYEIIGNHGDNLAQDTHQSTRNLHLDKCLSASFVEQSVQHRVKRSSSPSSPSLNTQYWRDFTGHTSGIL
ncbi:hypothetical protein F511_06143 [Dorcoceras hygrometricum]|uniref:Uncharacterized protein n=1 Tax=Dorcoceras hygrometricum TaxID=472368 RepID=A0A2Z7CII3_9LAMI|nr:hypothetical protein F511_06143 [Dorcoceras hygrometricum]